MAGNKDTILATAILFDIPECPCHSFGGIFYISRILCFRTQTIINRHYCKALIRQFLGNKFTSSFHTTAMKPYNGGKIFFILGIINIQFTTFQTISICFGAGNVRYILVGTIRILCLNEAGTKQKEKEKTILFHGFILFHS